MWPNTCITCLRPFNSQLRLAYCPSCISDNNPELCESDCSLAGVDTPAIIKFNCVWYCALCAETHGIKETTKGVVLTDQMMHSLTTAYLVNNLDN